MAIHAFARYPIQQQKPIMSVILAKVRYLLLNLLHIFLKLFKITDLNTRRTKSVDEGGLA